ncbi:unnamed protein product [Peniophora sp. CBMAI 1063]|nr:unnamed protein product [Peniophora sp. CBMAI 1063]
MAENTAFSSSGEDAMTRPVELNETEVAPARDLSPEEFAAFYELDRVASEINSGGFKRTALQFPDELLPESVPIYRSLKRKLSEDRELYVLADTSYGSCCADEVAAQHVDAEAIVHFGHACMSKTYRMPVIYVFGKKDLNPTDAAQQLVKALKDGGHGDLPQRVVLRHDVAYIHLAGAIRDALDEALSPGIEVLYHEIPNRLEPASSQPEASSTPLPSTSEVSEPILYVGPESLGLTNLLMTHAAAPIYRYDPSTRTASLESGRTNKLLMRRYAVVQRARDADVFGILVGTLGVASYLPLIKHLRSILAAAHKKSYTVSVGKLNPAKLANFAEIECFVLVACPENSVIDAKEFYRPIVTPYELTIALAREPSWGTRYELDFGRILSDSPGATEPAETGSSSADEEERDPDAPSFSLVTGKYRTATRYHDTEAAHVDEASQELVLRSEGTVATLKDSAAGAFLQRRHWKGLEVRSGMDALSVLEQGREGGSIIGVDACSVINQRDHDRMRWVCMNISKVRHHTLHAKMHERNPPLEPVLANLILQS